MKEILSLGTLRLLIAGCALAMILPDSARANGWTLESYGEALTLESEGGTSASAWTHARWQPDGSRWLPSPYAGAAFDSYRPDNSRKQNRFSPLAGAQLQLLPELKLFAEYRYVYESPATAWSRSDFRAGLIGGLWRELALQEKLSLFSDSYAELISVSRISSRPALTAFSKIGPRYRLLPALSGDLFLEAYGRDSDDLNLGRRALELRYGARTVFSFGKDSAWSISFSGFRRIKSWRDAPDSRWRALLAIGGSL